MRKSITVNKVKSAITRTVGKTDSTAKVDPLKGDTPKISHRNIRDKLKTVRIDARIPSHVKEIVQHAASIQGRSQTDFMVTAIHDAAQRVIAESSVIRLCLEDQRELAAALRDEAPSSTDKGLARLRRAVHDHGKKVKSL